MRAESRKCIDTLRRDAEALLAKSPADLKRSDLEHARDIVRELALRAGRSSVADGSAGVRNRRDADERTPEPSPDIPWIEHSNRVLRGIRNVSRLIATDRDPLRLIDDACTCLTETSGYTGAVIMLLDDSVAKTVAVGTSGFPDDDSVRACLGNDEPLRVVRQALGASHTLVIDDPTAEYPEFRFMLDIPDIAVYVRRLEYDGQILGILAVTVPRDYASRKEELDLFDDVVIDLSIEFHRAGVQLQQPDDESDPENAPTMAAMGAWCFDLDAGRVITSEETMRIYGVHEPDLSIKQAQTIPLPRYRSYLDNALLELIRGDTPYDVEFRIRRQDDGAIRAIHSMAVYDRSKNMVIGTIEDITERRHADNKIRQQSERLQALVEILQYHPEDTIQDFLDNALTKAIEITGSRIGYIYFYNEESRQFELNSWSRDVMKECAVVDPQVRYELDDTGIWGEVVRQRRPILLNDYRAEHPLKRGLPEGHVSLDRFLSIPIIHNERIVAVAGVADKASDYDTDDVLELTLLMDVVWKSVENRRGDQALHERERYLSTIMNTTVDGFWVVDDNGVVTELNDAFCRMLGYSRDELLGKRIADIDAFETENDTRNRMARISRNGSEIFETRQRRKDGSILPVEVSSTYLAEDGGQYVCFGRDLTERKQHEEQISLQGHMLDAAPASITIHDEEGHFVFANQATLTLHGYDSLEEFLSINLHDLDVPESEARLAERFRRIAADGEARFEVAHYRKDGSAFPLEILARSIDWRGGRAVLSIGVDISKRKEAEEELQRRESQVNQIFEILPIGLWFADKNGKLLRGNPAGVKIWGAEPHVPISEYGIFKAWKLPSREPIEADDWALAKTIRNGETIVDELIEIEAFDGLRKTILNYTAPVLDNNGMIDGAIIINLDISDRQALENQLRQAQKMEAVGRLAGGVAHDFNNMLSVISGNAELVLSGLDESNPHHGEIREILNASKRSADLTRQLLAFARKQTVAPKVLDLNETIDSMLKMLQRIIGEDIDLLWKPNKAVGYIHVDPAQIDQILANLVVNARDAIGHRVGKVTIETDQKTFDEEYCAVHTGFLPGDYVMLAISDDGCGMDAAIKENIFEPFFTTKRQGEGTGLGLATVYGIVKQNRGFIAVYSEREQGTTFRIFFPLYRVRNKGHEYRTETHSHVHHGQGTILLVEDEPAILALTVKMLKRSGFTVLPAATPGEAIRLAEDYSDRIDLLMTDVVMPEMNGRDLARRILELYPNMKRLFMSGYTADVIAHQGVLDDDVNFIQKPFSMPELSRKVNEVFDEV